MTKNKTIIIATIIMTVAAILVGCNQSEKVSEISTTQNTTLEAATVQTTNQVSIETTVNSTTTAVESTTMKKTNQKEKESSTAKDTTTQKSKVTNTTTTTKKNTTTQKPTTTKSAPKQTTTKKETTTKKVTTTKAEYWCDEGGSHHLDNVGQIGWVNSEAEATEKALRYIENNADSGGFRVNQCPCGKWTAYITLD